MADRITRLIPSARSVVLAGRAWPVWECRVRDLADLQGWLDSKWTDPLLHFWDAIHGEGVSETERENAIVKASVLVGDGPAVWGSEEAQAWLSTPEGVAVFLFIALRRGSPEITAENAVDVLSNATGAEFASLRRSFWGITSETELTRLMFPEQTKKKGEATTWGEAIDEVSRSHGWTYETIYDMSLSEFRNAQRNGEPNAEEQAGGVRVSMEDLPRMQAELAEKLSRASAN